MTEGELNRLWKSQPVDVALPDLGRLKQRADGFRRTIRARNAREYLAAALVIAIFGVYAVVFPNPLMRAASLLTIAAAIFVVVQLHRRASWIEPTAEQLGATCLVFHRSALLRQRDALNNAWAWYVLPFVPCAALFLAGVGMERPDRLGAVLGIGAAIAVFAVAVGWLNRLAAGRMQREIDRLDQLAA